MKIVMEFNLPDDEYDFEMAKDGAKLRESIEAYDQQVLRPIIKYGISSEVLDAALEGVNLERSEQNVALAYDIVENITQYLRRRLWENINE